MGDFIILELGAEENYALSQAILRYMQMLADSNEENRDRLMHAAASVARKAVDAIDSLKKSQAN